MQNIELMNEFVSWTTLGTFGGCLSMVVVLTQLTKDATFIKHIKTQLWSYILAVIILLCSQAFTSGMTIDKVVLILFNGGLISLSANGGFSVIKNLIEKPKQND